MVGFVDFVEICFIIFNMMEFILANGHWFWLGVMVVCIVVEACTMALTTVWAAIAALPMIFISKTGMAVQWQLLIFMGLTVVLVVFTRPLAVKKFKLGRHRTNADSILGDEVVVTKAITTFEKGEVKSKNGVVWSAAAVDGKDFQIGDVCVVVEIQGNTLLVKK